MCRLVGVKLLLLVSFISSFLLAEKVVIIKLRSPVKNKDVRSDPFYDLEVASFGVTGCHSTNIMHAKKVKLNLVGNRVAFVQQGFELETEISQQRLILLTPIIREEDIEILNNGEKQISILKWNGKEIRPLKFHFAPILISNDRRGLEELVKQASFGKRETLVASFGSFFRTRTEPLDEKASKAVIKLWAENNRFAQLNPTRYAANYHETMNPPPRNLDRNRKASFLKYFRKAGGDENFCSLSLIELQRIHSHVF